MRMDCQQIGEPSLPVRGAWIEIANGRGRYRARSASLPVRGAWIEIFQHGRKNAELPVAPRAGSVD